LPACLQESALSVQVRDKPTSFQNSGLHVRMVTRIVESLNQLLQCTNCHAVLTAGRFATSETRLNS